MRTKQRSKLCKACGLTKELSAFGKTKKGGHRTICNNCDKQRLRAWKKTPYGRAKHAATNRTLEMQAYLPPGKTVKEIIEETTPIYYEAVKLTDKTGVVWEVDHVIPCDVARLYPTGKIVYPGGLHEARNLQLVPKHYNRRKKNWVAQVGGEYAALRGPMLLELERNLLRRITV